MRLYYKMLSASKTKRLHPDSRKRVMDITTCPMLYTVQYSFLNTVISVINSVANLVRKVIFVPLII